MSNQNCACGAVADLCIQGKDAVQWLCSKCAYGDQSKINFHVLGVKKAPIDASLLNDAWTVGIMVDDGSELMEEEAE